MSDVKVGQWWLCPGELDRLGFRSESIWFRVLGVSETDEWAILVNDYSYPESRITRLRRVSEVKKWTKWEPNWFQRLFGWI